jgi:uncharacterized Zn-binding protein involved in type VI secretion
MSAVALAGTSTAGGGALLGNIDAKVRINDRIPAVVGTRVASHGTGPHAASTVAQGNPKVLVGGNPIARAGDLTSCAHAISGGSSNVNA